VRVLAWLARAHQWHQTLRRNRQRSSREDRLACNMFFCAPSYSSVQGSQRRLRPYGRRELGAFDRNPFFPFVAIATNPSRTLPEPPPEPLQSATSARVATSEQTCWRNSDFLDQYRSNTVRPFNRQAGPPWGWGWGGPLWDIFLVLRAFCAKHFWAICQGPAEGMTTAPSARTDRSG
jgi:hypothetical protein